MALLVAAVGVLVIQARLPIFGEGSWVLVASLVFAAGIAWRDSDTMLAVNLLAVLLTLGLAGHRAHAGWPRLGGLLDYAFALASAAFHAMGGVLALALSDIHWREVPRTGW